MGATWQGGRLHGPIHPGQGCSVDLATPPAQGTAPFCSSSCPSLDRPSVSRCSVYQPPPHPLSLTTLLSFLPGSAPPLPPLAEPPPSFLRPLLCLTPAHPESAPKQHSWPASQARCAYSSRRLHAHPPQLLLLSLSLSYCVTAAGPAPDHHLHHVHASATRTLVPTAGATALTSFFANPPSPNVRRRELALPRPHKQQKPCHRSFTPNADS